MNPKKMMAAVAACLVLCSGAAFAEEQVDIQKGVIDTLRHAPRLEMIKSNREAVGYDLEKSKGRWYPKLDVRGGAGTNAYSSSSTRDSGETGWEGRRELGAYVTQRIYDGGDASGQIRLDKNRLASLEHRVFDNAESLALDSVIATLEVYRQRELLFLAEENVRAHRDILGSLKEREQAGAGSVADVTQTEARMSMALASVSKTRASLVAALSEFQRLTGYLPGKIDLTPYPADALPANVDEMVSVAKSGNPKVSAATEDVNSDLERVNIQRATFHPYVYGELSSSYSDGVASDSDWTRTDLAMLRFNWNLYNGGSDVAATKAARWRMRQTASDKNTLGLAVESETRTTWAQFESAASEVREYTQSVKLNQNTKEIYLEQFGVAQRSLLDVLDSENEVFQASNQLVTSKVNEQIAAYKLMALGGKLIAALGVDPTLYKEPLKAEE